MAINKNGRLILPALRGVMGNRPYYSCLMSFNELARRVSYANEVHQNESLSDMIQRKLNSRRSEEIARYLSDVPERFFNSLVVATYDGEPNWHPLSNVKSRRDESLNNLSEETIESVGFLTLNGDEKLFAVDGQHRLSGIKRVVRDSDNSELHDEVSVIFVEHKDTPVGLQQTRRLFTTLNKTARPVRKGEIIALDEDDVMAICARRLVENTALFSGARIAFVAGNNMPVNNTHSLTTIGNLYDVLGILFSQAQTPLKKSKWNLQRARPTDDLLDEYFELAQRFFTEVGANIQEVGEFFDATDTEPIVAKHRGSDGGSALFRPIGLDIFARVVAELTKTKTLSLSEAVELAAKLPTNLSEAPYVELMRDTRTGRILNSNKALLREILLHMLGGSKESAEDLTERYRRIIGSENATLPMRVV